MIKVSRPRSDYKKYLCQHELSGLCKWSSDPADRTSLLGTLLDLSGDLVVAAGAAALVRLPGQAILCPRGFGGARPPGLGSSVARPGSCRGSSFSVNLPRVSRRRPGRQRFRLSHCREGSRQCPAAPFRFLVVLRDRSRGSQIGLGVVLPNKPLARLGIRRAECLK